MVLLLQNKKINNFQLEKKKKESASSGALGQLIRKLINGVILYAFLWSVVCYGFFFFCVFFFKLTFSKNLSGIPSECHAVWIIRSGLHFVDYYFSEKIRFDISCELAARQTIYIKCEALFSLRKKSNKIKVWPAAVLISAMRA